MTVEVKRDKLDALLRSSKALPRAGVKFGSMGPDGTPAPQHPGSDLNVAQVLEVHEFGLGVPERPVVRAVVHGKRDELANAVKAGAVAAVLDGASDETVAKLLGEEAQRLLLEAFDRVQPPLAPETLEDDEGSSQPLQDTGAIRDSLRWARDRR